MLRVLQKTLVLTPAQYKSLVIFVLGILRSHDKLLLLVQSAGSGLPSLDGQTLNPGAGAIPFSTTPEILLTLLKWTLFLKTK